MPGNLQVRRVLLGTVALAALATAGCSVRQLAVRQIGSAVAGGGDTFASDDDPDLVKAAAPFSLKLMESLLAEDPANAELLLAASRGFAQYAFAFVQEDADEIEARDFAAAQALRGRAKRLFLRARSYGLRGLEARHRGFAAALPGDPRAAVGRMEKADVAQLYWTAAAWGAAISLGKDDPALIAEIPQMEALIDRALALDEAWGEGSIHSFLITYEMSRTGMPGDPAERSRRHFARALALADGRQAAPYVALAEAVCVQLQDAAQFERRLNQALAVDPNAAPESRLANLVMQRRARWLLTRTNDLFLNPVKSTGP